MKKALYLFIFLLVSASSFSQVPQGISYQAVVRNASNVLVSNSTVSAFITIQKDSANGTLVYGEIDNATTNANGLFSVVIGRGQSQIGSLSNINWGNGVYYIRSAIDPAGGTNRTIVGSSQILSVPYALYAANGTANGNKVGDMQYWDGTKWTLISAGTNGSVLTLCNGVPTWGGCGVVATIPTVTTATASALTSSAATLSGNVTSDGGATVTSRGFCYSTNSFSPSLSNSTVAVGSGTGVFSTTLSSLAPNTTYYVTAYATNSVGTNYGTPISFTTISSGLATITTTAASTITSNSAVLGGNITSDGGYTIISRGICYASTTASPTLANSSVAVGNGTGSYSTNVSGLTAGTTYYVVAYATNSLGITTYGAPVSFNTASAIILPTVTSSAASSITSSSAILNGNVTADGGANVTSNGFCYSTTNSSPTLTNSTVAVSSGAGAFSSTLSGLTSSSTYYVTAYATNSAGTSYSAPITFTTSSNGLPSITTTIASSITSNSAVLGGNISNDGGYTILSRGICYSSTNTSPTLANSIVTIGNGIGAYTTTVTGLTAGTTYYVVAYATNNLGITTYGMPVSFIASNSSSIILPSVTSSPATSVTSTSALINGNVTADGGSAVTSRGICYSFRTVNPTLDNPNIVTSVTSGSGTGSFTINITGLLPNTTYVFTIYATNSAGTSYSTPISFTTGATTTNYTIGQAYGGGTIFYIDGTGHGLIAALSDQGTVPWDLNNSGGSFAVTGATDTSLGSGLKNTTAIKTTLLSAGSYAANIATQTANGYSDWYLPSLGELQLMYINLASAKLGNLSSSNVYWSASEYSADATHQAWVKDFGNNSMYGYWKSNKANVRAIRKF